MTGCPSTSSTSGSARASPTPTASSSPVLRDAAAEHEAVRERAGADRPLRAGEDRGHRQGPGDVPPRALSNDVKGLAPGQGNAVGAPRRPREDHRAPRRSTASPTGSSSRRTASWREPLLAGDRPLPLLRAGGARGRERGGRGSSPSRARGAEDRRAGGRRGRCPTSRGGSTSVGDRGRGGHPGRPDGGDGRGGLRPLGAAAEGSAGSGSGSREAGARARRARGVGRPAGGGRGRAATASTSTPRRSSWRRRLPTPTPSTRAATSARRSSRASRTAAT